MAQRRDAGTFPGSRVTCAAVEATPTSGSNVKVNRMCGWASKTIHGSTDQGTLVSVSADLWRPEPIQFAPRSTAENPLDLQPEPLMTP